MNDGPHRRFYLGIRARRSGALAGPAAGAVLSVPAVAGRRAALAQAYSVRMARGLLFQKASALMPQSRARKYSQAQGKASSSRALAKGFRRPPWYRPWAANPQHP